MSATPDVRTQRAAQPACSNRSAPVTRFPSAARPVVRGKFLYVGEEKLILRGVTYGTFEAAAEGHLYPDSETVERDFALMARHGFNTFRTYTVPPLWLLDSAWRHGLRVLVGLPWEQHITFLNERARTRSIEEGVRRAVASCVGHPAVLAFSIGNEIPASIARWHGRRALEQFLERLSSAVRATDATALVTYVNYPTTEYLDLPFLDFVSFNVYLESQKNLEAYLARLQHIAGDRPLIMAEIGLDSRRHGEAAQARTIEWQIRTTMASGCAGAFVFAWTDEWHRGGMPVLDWDFGLTTRQRMPKEALLAARDAFADVPSKSDWPKISVVVCTYNGARTLESCLQGLSRLRYPDYEVIVVDDGSTDSSAQIASRFNVRLIQTPNQGLSQARNTGLAAARGEIVAYLDDDAWPDTDWLFYLAAAFQNSTHAGIGGPNIAPTDEGFVADCVLNAPGGPIHVMLTDREAEHIPGCNMAFRRERLEAAGGFDARFRTAGDDVDLCWRFHDRGWTLGFSPAAMVWHRRRGTVRAFWQQQKGYGQAEAILERKWPEKYNSIGHVRWHGRLYGKGLTHILGRVGRIYHGVWGQAPFQPLLEEPASLLGILPTLPEWYLVILSLAALSLVGLFWTPLLLIALPLLGLAGLATLVQSALSATRATKGASPKAPWHRCQRFLLITALHLLQPAARLYGRLRLGLTAWRLPLQGGLALPLPSTVNVWSESWHAPEQALGRTTERLRLDGVTVRQGGNYDRWDLEVRRGLLGVVRLLMTVEEHGEGRQYYRFRLWPRLRWEGCAAWTALVILAVAAFLDHALTAGCILSAVAVWLTIKMVHCSGSALASVKRAIRGLFNDANGSTGDRSCAAIAEANIATKEMADRSSPA